MPAQRGAHGLRGSGTVPLPPRGPACKAGKLGVEEKQSHQSPFLRQQKWVTAAAPSHPTHSGVLSAHHVLRAAQLARQPLDVTERRFVSPGAVLEAGGEPEHAGLGRGGRRAQHRPRGEAGSRSWLSASGTRYS